MKKNIFDKMSESYDNFHLKDTEKMMKNETFYFSPKMKLFFAWFIFLIICVVLFFVVGRPALERKKKEQVSTDSVEKTQDVTKETTQKEISEETVQTDSKEDMNISYEKNTDEDLNAFIKLYFNAMAACDNDVLQEMVIDGSQYNKADSLKKKAEFVTGYDNITVYTKEGPDEGNYVAFVVMNLKIVGVNSSPYDIVTLFVVDGSHGFLIDNSNLIEERKSFIEEVKEDPDIQKIFQFVDSKNEELRKNDPTLQAFYDTINGKTSGSEKDKDTKEQKEAEEEKQEQDEQQEEVQQEQQEDGQEQQDESRQQEEGQQAQDH